MDKVFWAFVIGYLLLSIILVPFQYRYIAQLEKLRKANEAKGKSQGEMFEEMEFENQVLHANAQGNLLFFLANILATVVYKIRNCDK